MKSFKFFNNSKTNWEQSGLLEGATNVYLLVNVLDITRQYMLDNNIEGDVGIMLLCTMTRLYRDKNWYYDTNQIMNTLVEVEVLMLSRELSDYVRDIKAQAFMTVDVEMETVQIVVERLNWEELW